MKDVSEELELLLRVADGDRPAFNLLYRKYLQNLRKFVASIFGNTDLADELVQDIFVKIWLHRKNLPLIRSFKPYLYRCARNLLIDHIRKSKTQIRIKEISKNLEEDCSISADDHLIYTQTLSHLNSGINLLPKKLYIKNQICHVEPVETPVRYLKKVFRQAINDRSTSLVVILAYAGILMRLH